MEYFLNEQQKLMKNLARQIAEERILPVRAELDEKEEFPRALMNDLAASDLFRIFVPEEYDGIGGGCFDLCLVVEELSRVCSGVAVTFAASGLGSFAIRQFGSEEQKRKYLPDVAAGKKLTAFALTEATAGSDAAALKATADKVPGGYVLNGAKQFITNAREADVYTVIALTDKTKGSRGASSFIVEKGTPGFSFGKKEHKMGIRASVTGELIFQNCFVPDVNLIGKEGMGFIQVLRTLDWSRPGIGAQAVGVAQGALEAAVDYAKQRVQFDHPIIALPVVQHKLADMAIKVEAARALVYAVARTVDSGAKQISEESSMAKVFASDVAMEITTDAVQVFGGAGYMRDYPVEKMMRDAKVTQIYEGANDTLRNNIAGEVRKRGGRRD